MVTGAIPPRSILLIMAGVPSELCGVSKTVLELNVRSLHTVRRDRPVVVRDRRLIPRAELAGRAHAAAMAATSARATGSIVSSAHKACSRNTRLRASSRVSQALERGEIQRNLTSTLSNREHKLSIADLNLTESIRSAGDHPEGWRPKRADPG